MMIKINRRSFIILSLGSIFVGARPLMAIEKLVLTDVEWQARLSDEEYYILRKEGTERPGTSILNNEKRKGVYHCVGCEQPLFNSEMKFDSGTGWPSFLIIFLML